MRPYPLMKNYKRTDHSNLIDALREWKSFSDNVENNFEQATFIFSQALKGIDELEASNEFRGKNDYIFSLIHTASRFYNIALDEYIKLSGKFKPTKYLELLHLYLKDSKSGEGYIKKEYELYTMGLAAKRVEENHNIIQKRFDIKSIIVKLLSIDEEGSDIYYKYRYIVPILGVHLASLIDTYRMDPVQKAVLTIEELNYVIKYIERNSKEECFSTIFDNILGPAFYYINAYKDTDDEVTLEDIVDELLKANWIPFDGKQYLKNSFSEFEDRIKEYKGLVPVWANGITANVVCYILKTYAEDNTIGRPKSFFNFINEADYPMEIKGIEVDYTDKVFLYAILTILPILYIDKTAEGTHIDDPIAIEVFVKNRIKESKSTKLVCDAIRFSSYIIGLVCGNEKLGNFLRSIADEYMIAEEKKEEKMDAIDHALMRPSYIKCTEMAEEAAEIISLSEAYSSAPKFNICQDTIIKFPEAIPFFEYYARTYPEHLDRDILLNRAELVIKENAISSKMDMDLAANISKVNTYRNRLVETVKVEDPVEYFRNFTEATQLMEDIMSFIESYDSDFDDDYDDDDDEKEELTPKQKQEQKKKVEATKKSLLSRMADVLAKAGGAVEKVKPKLKSVSSKIIDVLANITTMGDEEKIAQLKTKILPNLRNILMVIVTAGLAITTPYLLVLVLVINAISTTNTSVETKKIVKDELDVELGIVEKKLNTADLTEHDEKKLLMLKSKINRQIERIDKEIEKAKSKK